MTLICTVPVPAGERTVICVPLLLIVTSVPGVDPNDTVESLENPLPVMVTVVPPVAGPEVGETLFTTGT